MSSIVTGEQVHAYQQRIKTSRLYSALKGYFRNDRKLILGKTLHCTTKNVLFNYSPYFIRKIIGLRLKKGFGFWSGHNF